MKQLKPPLQALWQQCWGFGGERWTFSGCCCSHIHPGMWAGREGCSQARAGPQSIQHLLQHNQGRPSHGTGREDGAVEDSSRDQQCRYPCSSFLDVHLQGEGSRPCHTFLCTGVPKVQNPLGMEHTLACPHCHPAFLMPLLQPLTCIPGKQFALENTGFECCALIALTTKAVDVLNSSPPNGLPARFGYHSLALLPSQSHKWSPLAFPKPSVTFN